MENIIIKKYCDIIIGLCLKYINNNSKDIDKIYIFLSYENSTFFSPYFSKGDIILKKNKLNEISSVVLDNSDEAQSNLDDVCIKEMFELKKELASNNHSVPTQIKIIYSTLTNQASFDISYTNQIVNKETTLNIDLAEKWFAELGGTLRPNSLYRMKQLFGDEFLNEK